ncbi:helix-turn-helix transcriptional regulator [Phenylobacterium sp.]|uniref:helix-turn-helix transcriptional regulator n=1 Tax=Phenylobacterium sp. TaxID=1871053 RepID=UPI002FC9A21E
MNPDEKKKAEQKAQGRRLKAAREHLGHQKAKPAAKFHGFSVDTYPQHENGTRSISRAVKQYAEAFGVAEEWLLYGRNPPSWATSDIEHSEEARLGAAEHFLRPWRLFRGLTVADLSGSLGVPSDAVEDWEDGKRELSDKWLRKIADIMDATPGAILDVDPGAVPPALLEMWIDHARRQRQVLQGLSLVRNTAA